MQTITCSSPCSSLNNNGKLLTAMVYIFSQILLELARSKNSTPLSPIKPQCGIRLPPDRYCLTQPNYKLKSNLPNTNKKPTTTSVSSKNFLFLISRWILIVKCIIARLILTLLLFEICHTSGIRFFCGKRDFTVKYQHDFLLSYLSSQFSLS